MDHKLICEILNSEMELATGCTEPAAIALCAANARAHLKGEVAELTVLVAVVYSTIQAPIWVKSFVIQVPISLNADEI